MFKFDWWPKHPSPKKEVITRIGDSKAVAGLYKCIRCGQIHHKHEVTGWAWRLKDTVNNKCKPVCEQAIRIHYE
jgi:ribosomal protein L32